MLIRFLDLLMASLAILLLVPILFPVTLILKFTGEGEIFFRQIRVGRGGTHFTLYKFATMLKDSPNIGTGTITMTNDPRVLPFGRYLRKTKVNELPQLLNVVFGDMSIIGPRPLTPQNFEAYPQAMKVKILSVTPGLSGVGSIIFRNEEDILTNEADPVAFYKQEILPYKGMLEEWYVVNRTTFVYIVSILLTVWVIMFPTSVLPFKVFKGLPLPPESLRDRLF